MDAATDRPVTVTLPASRWETVLALFDLAESVNERLTDEEAEASQAIEIALAE
jgi:hypothetical protein